jgi:hypothetical protein
MAEGGLGGLADSDLGVRFKLVDFVPALLVAFAVALIVAWDQFASSRDGGAPWWWSAGLVVGIAFITALILRPFQVRLVRMLEGYWPDNLLTRPLFELGVERHKTRRAMLERVAARGERDDASALARERSGWAREQLERYPHSARLLPTSLGNTLRAAEEGAGAPYGLDAIWAFPRLYGLIDDTTRREYDDLVDQYDSSARLAISLLLAAATTAPVLAVRFGGWALFALVGVPLGWLAYRGAVEAAAHSGELLCVSFDLHRFDLLTELHAPLPNSPKREVEVNRSLTEFFSQRRTDEVFPLRAYDHGGKAPTPGVQARKSLRSSRRRV